MADTGLSVLIVSFNCWRDLNACIGSVIASDYPVDEIIVVDNASVDGTLERLPAAYPQVHLVKNNTNVGHAKGVNLGLKVAVGNRILLLDADTVVRPDAIGHMCRFLDAHADAWMVAPRSLNSDGTIQETARNFPSPVNGLFGRQSLLTRLFPHNAFTRRYLGRNNLASRESFRVEFVSAACMLFDRRVMDRVGLLDEGYPGYWVDADWCMRIKKAGGGIFCVPAAVIHHHEQNKAFRKRSARRIIDFHAGVHRFYRIHYTLGIWDPRSIMAAAILALRAMLHLSINQFRGAGGYRDPLS